MSRVLVLALVALVFVLVGVLILVLAGRVDDSGIPVEAVTFDAPAPPPRGEESSTTVLLSTSTTTAPPATTTTVTTELPAAVSDDSIWWRLADCESGGRWHIFDSLHSGGLQFSFSTWRAAGGTRYAPFAHEATPEQQIEIAREWLARTSPAQWPVCGKRVGLTMADSAVK